jgi:hypothetical protein
MRLMADYTEDLRDCKRLAAMEDRGRKKVIDRSARSDQSLSSIFPNLQWCIGPDIDDANVTASLQHVLQDG